MRVQRQHHHTCGHISEGALEADLTSFHQQLEHTNTHIDIDIKPKVYLQSIVGNPTKGASIRRYDLGRSRNMAAGPARTQKGNFKDGIYITVLKCVCLLTV